MRVQDTVSYIVPVVSVLVATLFLFLNRKAAANLNQVSFVQIWCNN